jgi:hypothetical protein
MSHTEPPPADATPASDAADTPAPVREPDPAITSTRVNPKWLRNMVIYIILCAGIGVWGLIDALVVYPNRGTKAAEFFEFQYLDELSRTPGGLTNATATVQNPAETFTRLKSKSADGQMTPVETNQFKWLEQLSTISKSVPANTTYPRTDFRRVDGNALEVADARDRLSQLREKWTKLDEKGKPPPSSPLSWYDLPSQWLFVAFGLGLAPYLLFTILRVKARVYRFDHATHTLTLPGGEHVTPRDVKEFDKTKWHKVFITLHLRGDHPQLPGKSLELDLLRFVPLEEWVLKMERMAGR